MDAVIRQLKTLADPTRLRLLRLLALEELTVGELAQSTGLAQSRISNHLRILREEEFVAERREGAWHHYRLLDPLPGAIQTLWPELEASWKLNGSGKQATKGPSFHPEDLERLKGALAARTARSQVFFERIAGEWDATREEMFGDALARGILRALLPPGLVVADIGAGTGYVMELFGGSAKKIICVDSSQSMLKQAELKAKRLQLNNVELREGDAHKPPLRKGEADVASLVMVLHHLAEPAKAVAAAARAIKPGGTLLIADFLPHGEAWLQEHMEHRWLGFEPESLIDKAQFAEAGVAPAGAPVICRYPGRSISPQEAPTNGKGELSIPGAFLLIQRIEKKR